MADIYDLLFVLYSLYSTYIFRNGTIELKVRNHSYIPSGVTTSGGLVPGVQAAAAGGLLPAPFPPAFTAPAGITGLPPGVTLPPGAGQNTMMLRWSNGLAQVGTGGQHQQQPYLTGFPVSTGGKGDPLT